MQYVVLQRGTAVITALFIMALVAAMATAMLLQQQISIRRTQQIFIADQAYYQSLGVENWAITEVKQVMATKTANAWPRYFSKIQQAQATISGMVDDLQGRLNLNNVSQADYIPIFARLIQRVAPDLELVKANAIAQAVNAWLAPIVVAEQDKVYLEANPPFRAAHQFMTSSSELRMIAGVTAQLYLKLLPYICALPEITPININTASIPLLMAVTGLSDVKDLIAYRTSHKGFANINDFIKLAKLQNFPAQTITTDSHYFLMRANVMSDNQSLTVYSLLQAKVSDQKTKVMVLWQNLNTL